MPVFKSYAEVCKIASENNDVFSCFKRIKEYHEILEHLSPEQGHLYLRFIEENYEYLTKNMSQFSNLDRVGNPMHISETRYGQISPTTLRYIKVLGDLNSNFEQLGSMKIAEIGAGYGGQAKIILDHAPGARYTCFDLPEVCQLIQRYLKPNGYNVSTISSFSGSENYDLCISNYAFSELNRSLQDEYIENVISRSIHGYITMNFISHLFGVESYGLDEFIERLQSFGFKPRVMPETPETFQNQNKIVVW